MKIEEIIYSHKQWKTKLLDYISHPDKSLKPESCHENCCEFSKWMNSDEAHQLLSQKEQEELYKTHKELHRKMADIVMNANRGVEISEEMALGLDSPFHKNSESFFKCLSKIKSKNEDMAA